MSLSLYTYQLVRNVLAACVRDNAVDTSDAHALLLYDARNPAFPQNGLGMASFAAVARALRERGLLRRCSWQRVVARMKREPRLCWLTDALAAKYGLSDEDAQGGAGRP